MNLPIDRAVRRSCVAILLALWCGPSATAGGGAGPALLRPPALSADPVRELRIVATPSGDLLLATMQDHGGGHSWRGKFKARVLRVYRLSQGQWHALGGILNYNQPRPISNLDLATDAQGTPVAVWNENYGDNDVVVFRAYQQGAWTNWPDRYLGVSSPAAARTRAVAARAGEPVLIHGEYRGNPDRQTWLTYRAWDAAAQTWSRSVPVNDLTQYSRSPSVALDAQGRPVVAYLQGDVLGSAVLVKRWTGTAWETLGGPLNRGGPRYLASPVLTLDPAGRPTVAWIEDLAGMDALYVSSWNGQRWTARGGRLNATSATQPTLTLDRHGLPVVAWVEDTGSIGRVNAATWAAGAWRRLEANTAHDRDARSPSLTSSAAGVMLAWREDSGGRYRVRLARLD
ncbi:hypothetical protein E7T09_16455 [Deinococcus sp. KSM4-11]|uniref:hypothetical protein n=1 Tax=Deinococcus sp. KSM4-11 TaxID=2568654 RepID=UPI0010A33A36|nr:hypothetical protein [Deinococcus sp. KSM4-11]THF85542.1 hypothetical protein E7T09_16455 [Deinococcus sp. KSM4-11]